MRKNTTNNNPVKLNDKDLEDVDTFTYLGGIVTAKVAVTMTWTTGWRKLKASLAGKGKYGDHRYCHSKQRSGYLTA